jgi:hypothetical protein
MYDPQLGRWHVVDPLVEKDYGWTPYKYCYNNPLIFVDPDGLAEFIDKKGRVIGNDGIDDNKIYVIKTTQKDFDSGVSSAGISKEDYKSTVNFIKNNSGNSDAFKNNNSTYNNSVEIEGSAETRQNMVNVVSGDNGKGGTLAANNREYGGTVDNNGNVTAAEPGPVTDPSQSSHAYVNITLTSNTRSTFHSHPSGTKSITTGDNSNSAGASTQIGGRTTKTYSFNQAPSQTDISNTTGGRTNYVFGKGNGVVYIYNSLGIVATVPEKRFINFNR